MAGKMEEASERMWQLVNDPAVGRLQEANEAETRLLLVDRVLGILGWPADEYKPEAPIAGGGYTDYRLTVDRQQRLIVEAKKYGRILPLPKVLKGQQYSNSFLIKSCGEELTALLDQCLKYCQRCGIRYAVATTGSVWIVLVGFVDGLEWGNLHSYVFHSLEDAATRFSLFYDLISRDAVRNNSLEEHFGSAILVKPSVAIRPRDRLEIPDEAIAVPHRGELTRFFDTFMGDLTHPERSDMLEHCYVSSREIEEFSSDLQALLEYDAVLDEQEKPVAELDEDQLRKAIEYQWNTGIPKTILIAGRIGAGKSTFVQRFVKEQATAKSTVCVVVDLINRAARRADQTEREVQAIAALVLDQLFERFHEAFDPFDPSVLRACFRKEVDQFKSRKQVLLQRREEEYLLAEEQYLHELCADKYKHLVGYAQFLRKKRYKLWIALDNIDQGTYSYQEFVYAFAHQLSTESGSVTLITLREDTFLEAVEAGFLNVRSSDVVFRLNPPELRQVIAKRRRYIDYLLKHNKVPRVLGLSKTFVGALNWHLKALFLGQDDRLRRHVSALSLGNVRDSLQLIEDYYTSFHSRFHGFYQRSLEHQEEDLPAGDALDLAAEHAHFIQALMLRNGWSYDERESHIYNLFAAEAEEQSSHFVAPAILAYLSRGKASPKNTAQLRQLYRDFSSFGYPRHHVEGMTKRLLRASLLFSPGIPVGMSRKQDVPDLTGDAKVGISAKGYYFLTQLAADAYYQVRAAEDTVWYDEEKALAFTRELRDSFSLQQANDPDDLLTASDARQVFYDYLKRSWLRESQAHQARTQAAWARVVSNIVEERVFGTQLTRSLYSQDGPPAPGPDVATESQVPLPRLPRRALKAPPPVETVQLTLLGQETDHDQAFRRAAQSLGAMPQGGKIRNSTYLLKVLWALEVAARAGVAPIRASIITQVINEYGGGSIEATNVARFMRNQRQTTQFTHLWKESPGGYFAISTGGREMIMERVAQAVA